MVKGLTAVVIPFMFDGISFNAGYAALLSEAAFIDAWKDEAVIAEKWPNQTPEGIAKTLAEVRKLCIAEVKAQESKTPLNTTDNGGTGNGVAGEVSADEHNNANSGSGDRGSEASTGAQSAAAEKGAGKGRQASESKVQ